MMTMAWIEETIRRYEHGTNIGFHAIKINHGSLSHYRPEFRRVARQELDGSWVDGSWRYLSATRSRPAVIQGGSINSSS